MNFMIDRADTRYDWDKHFADKVAVINSPRAV